MKTYGPVTYTCDNCGKEETVKASLPITSLGSVTWGLPVGWIVAVTQKVRVLEHGTYQTVEQLVILPYGIPDHGYTFCSETCLFEWSENGGEE